MQTYKLRLGSGLPSKEPVGEETDRQTACAVVRRPITGARHTLLEGGERMEQGTERTCAPLSQKKEKQVLKMSVPCGG